MSINSEEEFNRHSISVRDFEKSIEFLQEIGNHSQATLLYEALLISALICYCRPFSSNERNKDAKATDRIEFKSFSDITTDEKSLHDKCITTRNKAVAHAEWSRHPTEYRRGTRVIVSRGYSILSENIDPTSLLALSEKLLQQCHHRRADYS